MTERTRAGVKAAKKRGVKLGPKPKLTPQQITHTRALRAQGELVPVIAALFNATGRHFTLAPQVFLS
jgi:DNA invertase Pin-like site-specific DNA recombinase